MNDKLKNAADYDDRPVIQVSKKKRSLSFMLMYCLFVADFIARVGINAIMPLIQKDLQLTDGQIGALVSCVALGMAVCVIPISYLGEKHSPKKAITISAMIWGIGSFLSGLANNLYILLFSRFLVGSGNSSYAALSNSLITSMYRKSEWGRKVGIYNTAMPVGMALGSILFVQVAATVNWRAAFYLIGAITMVLVALSFFLPDTKKETEKTTKVDTKKQVNIKMAIKSIFKNKALMCACLGAGLTVMCVQAVLAYLSIFLVREMNMSVSTAGMIISANALISIVALPIGGVLLDKWCAKDKRGRVWLPAICFSLFAICCVCGFTFRAIPFIFLAQFSYNLAGSSIHTATQELVPIWFKSVSYGTYVLFCQVLGAIGPICTGLLSDAIGISNALSLIQVCCFISAGILFYCGIIFKKDYEKARAAEKLAECQQCPE